MDDYQISLKLILRINIVLNLIVFCNGVSPDDRQVYIVYMGDRPNGDIPATDLHKRMIQDVSIDSGIDESEMSGSLMYSYHRSFNGFVANLTYEQMVKISGMEGVVSVFPNEKHQLHTTRSWDFMGLTQEVRRSQVESNIIVGVLDTGVWPESTSFSDQGFGPPPTKWKGICQESSNFSCNNKIIGARYYHVENYYGEGDILSPRDMIGHGSHTASAAAGNLASLASMAGLAVGTAKGGVPSARIAVYKVSWSDGANDADILAAFDDAIADGVDIISISIGSNFIKDYFNYSIAIASFYAMKHGILTSTSAGNFGPDPGTIINFAPWALSVAASTTDRSFVTNVVLGNGANYEGVSINTFTSGEHNVIYAGNVPNTQQGFNSSVSRYCRTNSLDPQLVTGNIVLCDFVGSQSGKAVAIAGGVGAIMQDDSANDSADTFAVPGIHLGTVEGLEILNYLAEEINPTATIFRSTTEYNQPAPVVVSFSSRGPNPITPDILKPDISAPGADILAAWTQGNSITGSVGDERVLPYNIISGTSAACPHATGAAAYVKSFHPGWSPSAIKSALMTTAFPMRRSTNPDAEFAYGSGHINPVKAVHPGLVYDMREADYVQFLCGQGYSTRQLQTITGDNNFTCTNVPTRRVWDLNYPSFTMSGKTGELVTRTFHRTVTNVGQPNSTYTAMVKKAKGLRIDVNPRVLSFNFAQETKTFVVTLRARIRTVALTGKLIWDDGTHQVRSPIIAYSL